MSVPPALRVFIAGASGSGKSTAAWHHYLQHFPRRILLDFTGEWVGHADITVTDVQALSLAMRKLAARGGRWTITAALDGEDQLEELVDYLIPVPQLEASPIRKVGGAVLLVDEVDLIAPPRSMRQEVRTLWRRSRHVGLSIVATTQRPEAVSREVSSQSQQVLCLQLVEPAALDYMADIMRVDLADLPAWWKKHPHGGLWRDVLGGRTLWLAEDKRLYTSGGGAVKPAGVVTGESVADDDDDDDDYDDDEGGDNDTGE